MKHMKTSMIRFAAVLMSLMTLLSTLVIPAAAAPLLDDSVNPYGITYADGIYTVSIDADNLTDILQSKTFDKQTLLQAMPSSLYNFLTKRDVSSAVAVLKELYAAADLGALKTDLPVHIITDKFTKADLLSVVDTDALMSMIDVDALIASVPADEIENIFKPGALDELIANADLSSLLSDTAKVEAALNQMTTDEILVALVDGAIEAWLGNGVVNLDALLTDDLVADAADLGIVDSDDLADVLDWNTMIGSSYASVDDVIADLYEKGKVDMDGDPIGDFELTVQVLIDMGYIDAPKIYAGLIDSGFFTAEKVMQVIDAGLLSVSDIVDNVTDMATLVKYVDVTKLPMDKVLNVFSTAELMDVVMANGVKDLVSYIDFKYLATMDATKDALMGISKDDLMAAIKVDVIKGDLLPKAMDAFFGAVVEIRMNDTVIYTDYALDVTAIEYAIADAIPTPADIMNVGADGVIASVVFSYDVYNATTMQFEEYTNGFQIALVGDTTALSNYASEIDALASFDVEYLGTDALGYTFTVVAPEKLAELYVSSLTNADLPQELRDKLFGIGNATLEVEDAEAAVDAAVDALFNKLTLNELRTVLTKVGLGGYNKVVLEKLDLYESQAETVRVKLIEALDRVLVAVVDSNCATEVYNKALSEFYVAEGRFVVDVEFTVEIPVPEIAESLVVNNVINHTVTFDATVTSLYEVQFVDGDQVLYTAYRTEGDPLAELFELAEVQLDGVTKWMDADKNVVDPATLTMPAADMTLTPVRSFIATFVVDGEIIGTDEFDPADPSTLDFPEMGKKQHYTLVWDDFKLDYADITITGSYVPTMYTATFMNGDHLWAVRMYTFETYPGILMPQLPVAPYGYTVAWSLPFLPLADVTIDAIYSPVTYYITFVDADGNEVAKVPFTIENIEFEYPAVPEKNGYIGTWPELNAEILLDVEYFIENGYSYDRTVEPIYDSNTYYVTFVDKDGNTIAKVPYVVGDTALPASSIPAVPAVKGYTNGKWASYKLGSSDITVAPVYELQTYYINFVGMDGKTVQKVPFTIESSSINAPAVPAVKGYKAGAWNTYKLLDEAVYSKTGSYDQTVEAKYELETYYITFVDKDGKQVAKVEFNIKSTAIKAPAVPEIAGYTGAWASYKLLDETVYSKTGSYNQTVKAVYEAIGEEKTYTATFVADGKEVGKVTFKATDSKITEPAVPAKDGYTGAWEKYTLGAADITINAVYTVVEYTVTFVADGVTVGTATYTVENKTITEPAVPEKEGYTGAWESYTLTTGDVTVNAVYTAEGGEIVPPVAEENNLLWLWILIAVVVAGGIAVAVVFIIKKKKA